MELMNDELRKKFEQYPLGSQDGKGFDAECIAKYFVGNCTWLASTAIRILRLCVMQVGMTTL